MAELTSYADLAADDMKTAVKKAGKGSYLEDGTLVGHLLPAIDSQLGKAHKLQGRLSY
ncbi:MAG: hypothetical protein LUH51_04945 [Firmicutes bacterium]|nr:hypothetical protein [Bacillota bacterium]